MKCTRAFLWCALLCVTGCDNNEAVDHATSDGSATAESGASQPDEATLAQWARSCALCHVNGEGGAPRVGHAAEWQDRIKQGADVLLAHTVEGFNNMPPLGYCMDCEEADLRALIDFMAGSQ